MRSGAIDVEGMGTMHAIHLHDYSNGRAEAHDMSTRSTCTACEICCANTVTT